MGIPPTIVGDLGLVYYHPGNTINGVRIKTEKTGFVTVYDDMPEVTQFTPAIVKRLQAMLPTSVFGVADKNMGMTGTDPEIFAFDSKGHVIPAWLWLKHKTENPSTYWDGVQGEFVTAPTSCHSYQTDNVRNALKTTHDLLMAYDPNARLVTADVVKLPRSLLLKAADEHIELGCSPSRNAYPEVRPIEIPDCRDHPYRYSGCHIHQSVLAYNIPSWFPDGTVTMIDKIAGVMLTALGRGMEDPLRRVAYGRAGEYRVPPPVQYANSIMYPQYQDKVWTRLEYRTPGSFLMHHPSLFNFACDVIRAAFRMGLIMDGRVFDEVGDVQGIINNCDADAAVKLIGAKNSFYHKVLNGLGGSYCDTSKTLSILSGGAKASGRMGDSVADNWKLSADKWGTDNYNNGNTRWSTMSGIDY